MQAITTLITTALASWAAFAVLRTAVELRAELRLPASFRPSAPAPMPQRLRASRARRRLRRVA